MSTNVEMLSAVRPALMYGIILGLAHVQFALAEQIHQMNRIEVIGSHITRVDTETAMPVQIITSEDIKNSGAVSIDELLRNVSAVSGGGVSDLSTGTGFSSGTAAVALRGLGAHATLVLLNGRRVSAAPYADPNTGQSLLFNLNAIPISAVERIEILKGGASAIYGSDAMAGVINIILRKNYQGAEAGFSYSRSDDGKFGNRQVHGVLGFGNPGTDRFNGFLLFTNSQRDAATLPNTHNVAESDLTRMFGRNTISSTASYPGNYFRESVPGNNAFTTFVARDRRCPAPNILPNGRCADNPHEMLNTVSEQEGKAVFGRGVFNLSANLSLFSELGFSRVTNNYIGAPSQVAETGSTWFAQNGSRKFFQFILPVGHPDNPINRRVAVRYRFGDVGPVRIDVTTDSTRLLLGAKGTLASWDWESGLLHTKIERNTISHGRLYFPALTNAINTRAYRPFGNNSAQTIASISPDTQEFGKSTNTMWDLKASRDLLDLAGGPLAIATGAEVRREELKITPDARIIAGDFVGLGSAEADGNRRVGSVFAELLAPFAKRVEAQLAARFDHYNDYGNSVTPQMGIKWKPLDNLALRASYVEGFRAPPLATIGKSNVQAFNSGLRDPLRCGAPGGSTNDCSFSGSTLISANPDLKPEKSDGQTAGILYSPNANVDLSMDFYRISRENEVDRVSAQFVINNEALFPGSVIRNPNPATWLPGVPNSGPIQSTTRQFFNLGRTVTRGIDFDAVWRVRLGRWGKLKTQLGGSYLLQYKNKLRADQPYISYQGGDGPSGELPRFKGNLATTWSYGAYSLTGRVNYVGGWVSGNSETPCNITTPQSYLNEYHCRIKPWTTVDLHFGYTGVKNLELRFSVRNIEDKAAPLDPNNTTLGFNPSFHNPYGRYFTISATYKFF
jgi:iron complex outermembrane receptor protein